MRAIAFNTNSVHWYIKGLGKNDYGCPDSIQIQFDQKQFPHKNYVPLVGNALQDGPRLCMFFPPDGIWYCKAVGRNAWGATPAPPSLANPSTISASKDVTFRLGIHEDCPIILNPIGHGFRAVNFRPSNKQWYFKEQSTNDWNSDKSNGNIEVDFANNSINVGPINTAATLPLYQGVVSTKWWPLTFSPFLTVQTGDWPTTVDLTTMTWYVNTNPKRVA